MAAGLVQATRRLSKDWRFSASMTLILGTAIGAGLVGWSVLDRVLMQPLPYEDADRLGLVRVDLGQIQNHPGLAMAEVADLRELDGAFVGAEAARAEFFERTTRLGLGVDADRQRQTPRRTGSSDGQGIRQDPARCGLPAARARRPDPARGARSAGWYGQ